MSDFRESAQDQFQMVLMTVVGQAFTAAGYKLQESPMLWSMGLFRFSTTLPQGLYGFLDWHHLPYPEGQPSRFKVIISRSDLADPTRHSQHVGYLRRDLSDLVVRGFGVAILPSADYWWTYQNITELGRTLGEAGSLTIGYALPYLSDDLQLPQR